MSELHECSNHPTQEGSFKRAVLRVIPVVRRAQSVSNESGKLCYVPVYVDGIADQQEAQRKAIICASKITADQCPEFRYEETGDPAESLIFNISTRESLAGN